MIKALNQAFCVLPGVGHKTAQRFIYHLLERNREGGSVLAKTLLDAMNEIKHCRSCRQFTERDICELCANEKRDKKRLCIVETSGDIDAIEQTQVYKGLYFVLGGYLSPIDGISAKELGIDCLQKKLAVKEISEVILATNATIEGEVTAHYLINIIKPYQINITRIAHGIPLGGELGYTDVNTIAHAISGREKIV